MIKVISLDVYDTVIILCTTKRELVHLTRAFHPDNAKEWLEDLEGSDGFTIREEPVIVYSTRDVDTVAHEAVHAAATILGGRDVRVDWPNEEALAYPVGYIAGKFFEKKGWMKLAEFSEKWNSL